jgi:hypothetical protein
MTVKEVISANIVSQRQSEGYKTALADIIGDLKKQAEIKIFDDNLSW